MLIGHMTWPQEDTELKITHNETEIWKEGWNREWMELKTKVRAFL